MRFTFTSIQEEAEFVMSEFQLCLAPKRKFLRKLLKSSATPKNLMKIYGDNQLHEETTHVYLCGTPALTFIGDVDHAEASHEEMCDGQYHTYCCSQPRSEGLQSWGHPCSVSCTTYKGIMAKMMIPEQNVGQVEQSSSFRELRDTTQELRDEAQDTANADDSETLCGCCGDDCVPLLNNTPIPTITID
ncbi:uncharacterized protein [Periplaneta americana]|uniref:uncharacterized protein n=1 Tax=Periplaneta americana TaxID=6978 RepID=UPI0037E837E2